MIAKLLLPFLLSLSAMAQSHHVWFGTTGSSRGIYHATFDGAKGKLSEADLAAEIKSPGFLALHPNGERLYAAGGLDGQPVVAAYTIKDGSLSLINSQPIGDGGAAHLTVHPNGRFLITAQYGGGSTASFPLRADGGVEPRSALHKHEGGSGVVGKRQNKPHAHWTGFDAAGAYAFVPDLGMDGVVIYKVNAAGDGIEPHGFAAGPAGGGPRHMAFSPDGKFAYVLNELSLAVTTFAYDAEAGSLKQFGTVPALTEEEKAGEQFNSASEIRVHPSGRFVYSANRGHDSITVYRAERATGVLEVVEKEPVRGAWPRNFNLDPRGKWLIAAGRDSDGAAVFAVDQETGRLSYQTRSIVHVPSPICVLFQ